MFFGFLNETLINFKMIDLSILIPTHKNPAGLESALNSINLKDINYEIIINNDYSNETFKFKTIFTKSHDLSDIYLSLLKSATGEYVYFLEDDDILEDGFESAVKTLISHDGDLAICNYIDYKGFKFEIKYPKIEDFQWFLQCFNHYTNFQLSRVIFKKEIIKLFPIGNNLLNDWHLFKNLRPQKFLMLPNIIYKQSKPRISYFTKTPKKPYYESENAEFIEI